MQDNLFHHCRSVYVADIRIPDMIFLLVHSSYVSYVFPDCQLIPPCLTSPLNYPVAELMRLHMCEKFMMSGTKRNSVRYIPACRFIGPRENVMRLNSIYTSAFFASVPGQQSNLFGPVRISLRFELGLVYAHYSVRP